MTSTLSTVHLSQPQNLSNHERSQALEKTSMHGSLTGSPNDTSPNPAADDDGHYTQDMGHDDRNSMNSGGDGGGGNNHGFKDDNHVTKLRENDVLLGRGGGTNNHAGNVKFRKLVNEHKLRYLAASKVDKPKVAREVVQLWRQLSPPGRFLARHEDGKGAAAGAVVDSDNVWYDVGDKKANAKASQCLRERTPEVMPYLRQLREQQDYSTEQGVMLVRQQQQQQQQQQHQQAAAVHPHQGMQHHHHPVPAFDQGPYGAPAYPTMAHSNPAMMSPGNGHHAPGAYMQTMGSHMSPHSASPMGMNPAAMSPGMARNSMPNGLPMGPPQAYISPRTQMQQTMSGGGENVMYSPNGQGRPDLSRLPPPPVHSAPMDMHRQTTATSGGYYPNSGPAQSQGSSAAVDDLQVAAYYGDMTDLEYEQSMMIMQQQLEMQQMQLRRMQQQRAMQRAALGTSGSPFDSTTSPPSSSSPRDASPVGGPRGRLSRQDFAPGSASAPTAGAGGASAAAGGATTNTRVPHAPPAKMTSHAGSTTTGSAARAAPDANARKPKRTLSMTRPERTPSASGGALRAMREAAGNAVPEDSELTLEEYRQQLEAYITNNQIAEDSKPGSSGEAGVSRNDGDHSDLEDDWEKERDKNLMHHSFSRRTPTRGVSRNRSRGVDRAKSGASFMSIATNKSNAMSMVSGVSDLSDLMAADHEAERERQALARTVSGQSNLSIMSELTDLSANIDNLSLYDD